MAYLTKEDILKQFSRVFWNFAVSQKKGLFISLSDVDLANLHDFLEEKLVKTKRIVGSIGSNDYVKLVNSLTVKEVGQMLWECFQYDICRVRLDEEGFEHWGSSLAVKINRIWEKDSDIVYNYSTHSIGFIYCKPFTSNATNGEIRDYSLKEEKKRYNVMCDFKSRITIVYKNADKLSELVDKKKGTIGELVGKRGQNIKLVIFLLFMLVLSCLFWYELESFAGGFTLGFVICCFVFVVFKDFITGECGLKLAISRIKEGIIENRKDMKHLKLDKYRKKLEKWLDMGLDVQDIYLQYQELQKSLVELYDFSKDYPPFKKMKILLENWLAFNIPTKVFYSQVMNKSDEN